MSDSAQYLIAQYVRNPLRREARNIGLVVFIGASCAAKFIGEIEETGEIDRRTTKWIAYPNVYRKWVKYWREQLRKGGDDLPQRLASNSGDNYSIIPGGFVTDYETDSPQTMCENLFALLVTPEEKAVVATEQETADIDVSSRKLSTEVLGGFRELGILAGRASPLVRHPVYHQQSVQGALVTHAPEFSQKNGQQYVMETVNFLTPKKQPAKHHAGYVAKMFDDIRNHDSNAMGIAIVHASQQDKKEKIVKDSLDLLEGSAGIVDWTDPSARADFLAERRHVATVDF